MKRGGWLAVGCALVVVGCGESPNQGGDDLTMISHGDGAGKDAAGVGDAAGDGAVSDDGRAPQPDLVPEVDATCDNTPKSCGPPGACVDCTNNLAGNQCVNNACGCNSAADCPMGTACDPNAHTCGASCANG